MTALKPGDKVRLKPNQTSENEVLAYLSYDTVYTVGEARTRATAVRRDQPIITLVECSKRPLVDKVIDVEWLARRFELVTSVVPERGDEVEVVLRGKVEARLEVTDPAYGKPRTVVYLEGDQSVTLFHDRQNPVWFTIIEPPKPKLDLDALPEGAVVEASNRDLPSLSFIYRKGKTGTGILYPWVSMEGGNYSAADLLDKHDELVELVRKDAA